MIEFTVLECFLTVVKFKNFRRDFIVLIFRRVSDSIVVLTSNLGVIFKDLTIVHYCYRGKGLYHVSGVVVKILRFTFCVL